MKNGDSHHYFFEEWGQRRMGEWGQPPLFLWENGRMGTATIISLACPLHAMFALDRIF